MLAEGSGTAPTATAPRAIAAARRISKSRLPEGVVRLIDHIHARAVLSPLARRSVFEPSVFRQIV